jgi:translation initiation factor IF-1
MVTEAIHPNNDNAIAYDGEVVRLLSQGGRRVRLPNGHILTVLAARRPRPERALVGDLVRVELGLDEREGWRLSSG